MKNTLIAVLLITGLSQGASAQHLGDAEKTLAPQLATIQADAAFVASADRSWQIAKQILTECLDRRRPQYFRDCTEAHVTMATKSASVDFRNVKGPAPEYKHVMEALKNFKCAYYYGFFEHECVTSYLKDVAATFPSSVKMKALNDIQKAK